MEVFSKHVLIFLNTADGCCSYVYMWLHVNAAFTYVVTHKCFMCMYVATCKCCVYMCGYTYMPHACACAYMYMLRPSAHAWSHVSLWNFICLIWVCHCSLTVNLSSASKVLELCHREFSGHAFLWPHPPGLSNSKGPSPVTK